MEEYHRFLAYQKRFAVEKRQPCVVTPDLYDLVTGGDIGSPLFHTAECPVIDSSRKEKAIEMLGGKNNLALVIM